MKSIVYDNNPGAMGYNAFVGTDHQLSTLNSSFFATSLAYASGPLGRYYISGTTLQDAGSRTAGNAGLYHFTTQTNQVKEANSPVDIGLHYVALGGAGQPADHDGDRFPDYQEDFNGNGSYDSGLGETDWVSPDRFFIGNESALMLPPSAEYSSVVNVRPGHGEVVSNNPPIFTWFYATNHMVGLNANPNGFWPHWADQTNAFQFQIATQASFGGTLAVDVSTPVNFYNFLAPLPTNATRQFWWRVMYITNGVPYWTNGIYNFTLAPSATDWDRSMLANTGCHATNGVHPIFCFRGGQQAEIWAWMQTNDSHAFYALTNRATFATNQSYFYSHAAWATNTHSRNPSYAVVQEANAFVKINDLGAVLNLWTFSGDNRWTNAGMTGWLITNLAHVANWFNHPSNNWAMADYGQPSSDPQLPRLISATYDWMYHFLGSDTATFKGQLRTNALLALQRQLRFWTHNALWSDYPFPTGGLLLNYGWTGYPTSNETSPWDRLAKIGTSHITVDTHIAAVAAVVIQEDGADGAFAFDWMFNYLLGKTSPYAGYAAHHVGPYGYTDNQTYERSLFGALMIFDVAHPRAEIWRNDFCRRFPEWYTRLRPYKMRKYHGPYSDYGPAGYSGHVFGDMRRGFDLTAISRSGLARQAWDLNREFSNTVSDINGAPWDLLPLRWHYRKLPAPQTNTTSAVYPEDGYVIATSISPSLFDCYTNGVGFSMRASPRGSSQGHNIPANLAPDLWAYGAQITDGGGANLDEYSSYAASSPGLFVNGLGEGDVGFDLYGYSQTAPVLASITAFTNSGTDFVYTCADGTAMFTNSYHPLKSLVTKVKRHVLFVRSKYWVIYDEFATTAPATFAFRWHVPWAFRFAAPGTALPGETVFTGNRIGSNSLAWGTNGFTYTAGNYADDGVPNPPRCAVHVVFATATSAWGAFTATGTNLLAESNPSSRHILLSGAGSLGADGIYDLLGASWTNRIGTFGIYFFGNPGYYRLTNSSGSVLYTNTTLTGAWTIASGAGPAPSESYVGPIEGSLTNSTLNPFLNSTYATVHPDRAVGMWITNRTAATNFTFVWAVIPQKPGVAAPMVQRLDSFTLAVTYDGVTETNTFGTNYAGAFTYRVETVGSH